jgi:hypothetical protein
LDLLSRSFSQQGIWQDSPARQELKNESVQRTRE